MLIEEYRPETVQDLPTQVTEGKKGEKAKSNKNVNDYSKSPKTYDAGIDGYVDIAGLSTSTLAFLQRREKEDEE